MNSKLSQKLKDVDLTNEKIQTIFEAVESALVASESDQAAISLGFAKESDRMVEGDLIPTITFALTCYRPED
jgi:hypothetical protein